MTHLKAKAGTSNMVTVSLKGWRGIGQGQFQRHSGLPICQYAYHEVRATGFGSRSRSSFEKQGFGTARGQPFCYDIAGHSSTHDDGICDEQSSQLCRSGGSNGLDVPYEVTELSALVTSAAETDPTTVKLVDRSLSRREGIADFCNL